MLEHNEVAMVTLFCRTWPFVRSMPGYIHTGTAMNQPAGE